MTYHDVVLEWAALGALNLAVAAMIGGVRPRRPANLVAAALLAFNGLLGGLFAYETWTLAHGSAWQQTTLRTEIILALNVVSLAAFIAFPFLFPHRRLGARGERALFGFVGALLLVNWGLLLVPGLRLENGFDDPILRYTSFVPFFAGLVVGIFLLLETYLTTPSRAQRTQALFILAAYVIKASSYVSALWVEAIQDAVPWAAKASPSRLAATVALAVAVFAVPVGLASSRAAGRSGAAGRRPAGHEVLLVLCAAYGALALLPAPTRLAGDLEYMLFRPMLFAYGLLQFQLLEVDLRARRTAVASTVLLALGAIFVVVARRAQVAGLSAPVATGLAFVGTVALAGLFFWPMLRVLLLAPEGGGEATSLRDRELYRVALEQAVAGGARHETANRRVLGALRDRLRISEREHAVMEASAKALFGHSPHGPIVGQRFLGRYRVQRLLGQGGFGLTYLAHDERMGRPVVLKAARVPSDRERRRLLREARVIARLRHPNIVAVHDVEEVAGDALMILEYLEGGSLADRLRRRRPSFVAAARILDDVLAALDAAHREGVVHRDLKPENVLLARDGRAKLGDFGVARADAGFGTATGPSFDGEHPGTALYMSPEQVRGGDLDARSDLYAAGALAYELFSARHYLDLRGRSAFDVRLAILDEPPRLPVRGLPKPVSVWLGRALAKDPAERFPSAGAMRGALAAALPSPTPV